MMLETLIKELMAHAGNAMAVSAASLISFLSRDACGAMENYSVLIQVIVYTQRLAWFSSGNKLCRYSLVYFLESAGVIGGFGKLLLVCLCCCGCVYCYSLFCYWIYFLRVVSLTTYFGHC